MKIILYFVLFAALTAALLLLPRRKATKRFGMALMAVALLFELLVCNFHSYHLLSGGYEKTTYTAESEELRLSSVEGNTVVAELNGLSEPIGTVKLLCDLEETEDFTGSPYVTVKIDAKDETYQSSWRSSVTEGELIRGDDRSAYLVLNLSGNVSDLRIRLTAKSSCSLRFESLTLNEAIPLTLSPLRLLLLVGAALGIFLLLTHPLMKKPFGESRRACRIIALSMTAVLILGAAALVFLYQYDRTGAILSTPHQTTGNQITQELVDAFEAGQVSLLDEPSEELLALQNPYDWSERSQAGIYYKWDHLLFEGKYYSYYGIAPVILLFLPYHLLTGYYFPTPEAVLLFGALGILFLTLAYLAFCELFAKKIPLSMVLTGLLICQFSSGVWFNFCSPLFYEIAQTSGFCFTCAGLWLLLRAGVLGGNDVPIRFPSLCLSPVSLSLAVLCRPTLAPYCVAALIFIFFGLLKLLRRPAALSPLPRRRPTVSYLLSALLPFAVIGGAQMLYNHVRFGSILDFGIQYSLTINDFTKAEYHTDLAMIGFHNFLFAFPSVRPEFPYLFANFSDLAANGYYYIANRYAIGLFFSSLPTWGYLAAPAAIGVLTPEERKQAIPLVSATCVLVPLVIIFSIWESGYGVRYCTDFAWQFILGAIGILFLLYVRRADGQVKRLTEGFFVLSSAVAFLCAFGLVYAYMSKTNLLEASFLSFERLFDFWI